jgi:hypothetical protein
VFYLTEMLIPALVNSVLTLCAVFFQLSTVQPTLLAFSLVSQILSQTMINARLPSFTNSTPTICKLFRKYSKGLNFSKIRRIQSHIYMPTLPGQFVLAQTLTIHKQHSAAALR